MFNESDDTQVKASLLLDPAEMGELRRHEASLPKITQRIQKNEHSNVTKIASK